MLSELCVCSLVKGEYYDDPRNIDTAALSDGMRYRTLNSPGDEEVDDIYIFSTCDTDEVAFLCNS